MCIFSLLNFLNNLLKTVLSYLERLPKCNAKKQYIDFGFKRSGVSIRVRVTT